MFVKFFFMDFGWVKVSFVYVCFFEVVVLFFNDGIKKFCESIIWFFIFGDGFYS